MLCRRVQVLRPRSSTSGGQGNGEGGCSEEEEDDVGVEREEEVVVVVEEREEVGEGEEDVEADLDLARAFHEATDVQDRQLICTQSRTHPSFSLPPLHSKVGLGNGMRWGMMGDIVSFNS